MKLKTINKEQYHEYKLDVIFNSYKWDPQVEDSNTVSKHVLLISEETLNELVNSVNKLSLETSEIKEVLLSKPKLIKQLQLPKKINKYLKQIRDYSNNVSLMRYDFHPTTNGFMISEVNSDVPGGLAEASLLPLIARKYINKGYAPFHLGDEIYKAFINKQNSYKKIAFVHATSYSDDRQVMQFLGDHFESKGLNVTYSAPNHLVFKDNKVFDSFTNEEIDGIVRFFPLEWLDNLSKKYKYEGYFKTNIPQANNPVNIIVQSKRLPLVWDKLQLDLPSWNKLLPKTIDVKTVLKNKEEYKNYIFKPVLGRVGEGISIKEVLKENELKRINKLVKKYPKQWISQERFNSVPVISDDGTPYHLCIGVFTVNNKAAGFYGRISETPRIDSTAIDIPILVYKEGCDL